MTTDNDRSEATPWYAQFWPWLLIAIPAAAVVAGVVTIWLATREPLALVNDDYYKEGLAVNRDLAKYRLARELGLTARVAFEPAAGTVQVDLAGRVDEPAALTLAMVHPIAANRDHSATLRRVSAGRYSAALTVPRERWYLDLEGVEADAIWRLSGEIDLHTALATPLSNTAE